MTADDTGAVAQRFRIVLAGRADTAHWLRTKHVIRRRTLDAILAANDVGNSAAHGQAVTAYDVGLMFGAVESLRSAIVRKVGI